MEEGVVSERSPQTPAEWLRFMSGLGTAIAANVSATGQLLRKCQIDDRIMVEKKLAEIILDKYGKPFSPVDLKEIYTALFTTSAPLVPALHRAFVASMLFGNQISKFADLDEESSEDKSNRLTEMHWAARWASFGLPVFQLTHGLTAALLLTEPPPFELADFHLPFPAFSISVPSTFVPFLEAGGTSSAELINVHCFASADEGDLTSDLLQIDIRTRMRNLWFRKPVGEITSVEREVYVFGGDSYTMIEDDYRTIEVALRLVRNLAAWIEIHGHGELENRQRKPGSSYTKNNAVAAPTVFVLGREIKIAPELRRIATEVALGEKHGGPGWKLRMRYCVRGHWKNQVCGEGRQDRKRIFVEPYWKGPEGAAAWAHVYDTRLLPPGGK